jgi:hypothetical protein
MPASWLSWEETARVETSRESDCPEMKCRIPPAKLRENQ